MQVSKKFKKNKTLFITLIGAGVVSLGLFVYVIIMMIQWSALRDSTEAAREKVKQLNASKPAPGAENERRIEEDIALYEEKNKGLVDNFKSPLRPAVDAFLQELKEAEADKLTDEEKELYKVEGTGVEATEGTKAVPLKIRKFTYGEFREFFLARFEKYCADHNVSEDEKSSLSLLLGFNDDFMQIFPQGSWNRALDKFVKVAQPLTFEVITDANRLPILLMAFDMPEDRFGPRRVNNKKDELQKQTDLMVEEKIKPIAGENTKFFAPGALNFIGGGSSSGKSGDNNSTAYNWAVTDYPAVFFHWDVYGDIAKRLFRCDVQTLHKVILRMKSAESGEGGSGGSQIDLPGSFEEDGNYKIYHYTVVFTCKMDVLRNVLKNFDNAWKGDEENGFGKRMYVVRALALYAGDDGADRVINPIGSDKKEQEQTAETKKPSRRRRRESAAKAESTDNQANGKEEFVEVPLTSVSEEEAKIRYYRVHRRLKLAENKKTLDEIRKEEASISSEKKKEFYENYVHEISLKMEERYGYAMVLIGDRNDECEVYLDIDYVVLKQNQQ